MESQTAYKMLFTDYPDVVNVEQMCEMLGGICDKTAYKLLKSGKIKRAQQGKNHILTKKTTKRARNLRGAAYVDSTQEKTISRMLSH